MPSYNSMTRREPSGIYNDEEDQSDINDRIEDPSGICYRIEDPTYNSLSDTDRRLQSIHYYDTSRSDQGTIHTIGTETSKAELVTKAQDNLEKSCTETTFECTFALMNGRDDKNQDGMTIESSFHDVCCSHSNEGDLDGYFLVPTILEFEKSYSLTSLPKYAIILGSKVSSHFNRMASIAYREARGTKNTELAVVYERLLKYFRYNGPTLYDNVFPQQTDELMFVRAENTDDCDQERFIPLANSITRDQNVSEDIRNNGTRSQVDNLKTMIDQKIRDLDFLNPAPNASTRELFVDHLTKTKKLIENKNHDHDELTINLFKKSIETMWDLFFTKDGLPKKRGRPRKDSSVVRDETSSALSTESRKQIIVKIRSLLGQECTLQVHPSDKVVSVKEKVWEEMRVAPDIQVLLHNRVRMIDDNPLHFYNVQDKGILTLILRLKGGGRPGWGNNDRLPTSDSHHTCVFADSLILLRQKTVNHNGGNLTLIEQASSPYLPPDNPSFTPSINGRAGWNFENCYDVKREIGKGSFGAIYMASHRMAFSNSTPSVNVAVKKTRPNMLDLRGGRVIQSYDDLERHCSEIKTLLHLQQGLTEESNVIYLYEYFMNVSNVYIITELLDQNLDVWRRGCGVLTESMVVRIGRSILKALKFISERNVVHRDVKLQNILFRCPGDFESLKLVDFGLSCIVGENERLQDFCGSLGCIAPEIYLGESYRFEVDMFSFGVILFRLLSSTRPFTGDAEILRQRTIECRYNLDGRCWEKVTNKAKDLVRKLLVERSQRLSAAQALQHPWFSSENDFRIHENLIQNFHCDEVQHFTMDAIGETEKIQIQSSIEPKFSSLLVPKIRADNLRKDCITICPRKKWFDFFPRKIDHSKQLESDGRIFGRNGVMSILQRNDSIIRTTSSISASTCSLDGSDGVDSQESIGVESARLAVSSCIISRATTHSNDSAVSNIERPFLIAERVPIVSNDSNTII